MQLEVALKACSVREEKTPIWFIHESAQTDTALKPHLQVTLKDNGERKSSKWVDL